MSLSPITILVCAIVVGVAGAVIVVIFDAVLADVVGGLLAFGALGAVTGSAIRLAGDAGGPEDDAGATQP
jgi:hypothetical protein